MNPLKQYFRRPSMYFSLPSGYKHYPPGVIKPLETDELAVYPMTASDEMILKTPDALFNGRAMVEVIRSCVPEILDPWQINTVDWEALLIAIRAATVGNTMDINTNCPECSEENTFEVNLATMLQQKRSVDYGQTLAVKDLVIKFQPLTYREMNRSNLEQYKIQRLLIELQDLDEEKQKELSSQAIIDMNTAMNELMAQGIEYIETPEGRVTEKPYILEFLRECDSKTHQVIQTRSVELRQANELKPLKVRCAKCSAEFQQKFIIDQTDFFV